jgi:MoxR-like ATPase
MKSNKSFVPLEEDWLAFKKKIQDVKSLPARLHLLKTAAYLGDTDALNLLKEINKASPMIQNMILRSLG